MERSEHKFWVESKKAADGIRTHDDHLGKVAFWPTELPPRKINCVDHGEPL